MIVDLLDYLQNLFKTKRLNGHNIQRQRVLVAEVSHKADFRISQSRMTPFEVEYKN